MRIFYSEHLVSYKTYTFGYGVYAQKENGDALSNIYERGFLPYSGSPDTHGTFYMARSARIPLANWSPTSENRRILKKFDGRFEKIRTPLSEFEQDEAFLSLCLTYFEKRHGPAVMPRKRLLFILNSGLITHVVTYYGNDQPVAYVLEVSDGEMGHFWFSFYDLSLVRQSLGMWLMIDAVRNAQAEGKTHYYLGTVYGEKALYKTNFSPIEYWTGSEWSGDVNTLKKRARTDSERTVDTADEWKEDTTSF